MPALAAFDVRIGGCAGHPHAVARSLVLRNDAMDLPASRFAKGEMAVADALTLWAEYNRRACLYGSRCVSPFPTSSSGTTSSWMTPRTRLNASPRSSTAATPDSDRLSHACARS